MIIWNLNSDIFCILSFSMSLTNWLSVNPLTFIWNYCLKNLLKQRKNAHLTDNMTAAKLKDFCSMPLLTYLTSLRLPKLQCTINICFLRNCSTQQIKYSFDMILIVNSSDCKIPLWSGDCIREYLYSSSCPLWRIF